MLALQYTFLGLGAIPLLFLGWLRQRGERRGAAFWWLAGAYGVSVLSDLPGLLGIHQVAWLASVVYPVSQASIIGAVLLDRDDAAAFVMTLVLVGLSSVAIFGVERPDLLLRTVACLGVAGIAMKYRAIGRVRWALIVSFGGGWLAWIPYVIAVDRWKLGIHELAPSFVTMVLYQATRAAGAVLFCRAAFDPAPQLRVLRRAA